MENLHKPREVNTYHIEAISRFSLNLTSCPLSLPLTLEILAQMVEAKPTLNVQVLEVGKLKYESTSSHMMIPHVT